MTDTFFPKAIFTIFGAVLLAATAGLVFAWGNSAALATVAVVAIGALILLLVQSRVREFSLGPEGVTAQLAKIEEDLQKTQGEVASQAQLVSSQGNLLKDQQELINNLVKYWMSASVFHHLCGIALLRNYVYHDGNADRREMYVLRDSGFIRPKVAGFVDFDNTLDGKNLVEYTEVTEIGRDYIKLRKSDIPANMLDDKANLRVDPSTL